MKKIHMILAIQPKIYGEVIRDLIDRQPDMEVVGEVIEPIELLLLMGAKTIDIVILAPLDIAEEPKICRHLLAEYPHLKIVGLTAKGDEAILYDAGFRTKPIDTSSISAILHAIRVSLSQQR